MIYSNDDTERFFGKFHRGHGCWEWKTGKFDFGYGAFKAAGKTLHAHTDLAAVFNLSQQNISSICTRRTWRHVA